MLFEPTLLVRQEPLLLAYGVQADLALQSERRQTPGRLNAWRDDDGSSFGRFLGASIVMSVRCRSCAVGELRGALKAVGPGAAW